MIRASSLRSRLAAIPVVAAVFAGSALAQSFKMEGSPVLGHVMIAAAPALREKGLEIKVAVEGSSTVAVVHLGDELVDFALTTRALTGADRARFPEREFKEFRLGAQAVAFVVPPDVWESGVRALSKAQFQAIYEGKIQNWKQLGGADAPIKYFNSERGRGVWEVLITWAYGEQRKAPAAKFPITVDSEDARNTVQFTRGALALASLDSIDGKKIHGLAIKDESGAVIEPTPANVHSGKYPLARPAMIVVGETPVGGKKKVIDFLLSPAGQEIVAQSGLIPLKDLAPK